MKINMIVLITLLFVTGAVLHSGSTKDFFTVDKSKKSYELEEGFKYPPQSAQPRVFWWWHEGQVTLNGITRDLKEMRDKGIGGAIITDAYAGRGTVTKPVKSGHTFGSLEWRKLYKHALKEANRLGIELSLHIQSGWNHGGPFIDPENAMKKIVWSELHVKGPANLAKVLPVSPDVREGFYRDIAVQAYKLSDGIAKKHKPIKDWDIKSVNAQFKGWKGSYPLHILREQYPAIPGEEDAKSADIINLTDKMDENGRLTWKVPEGEWVILRYGYTLTGARVKANNSGWEGLSLDHLSTKALDIYFQTIVDTLIADAGDLVGKSLKYLHTDSWEMGPVNWTANFPQEFKKRRGYDMTPFLPVMAGKIVDSRDVSNRFLSDVRRTIGDCIADNHYQRFADFAHQYGFKIHPESGGPHSAPIDALQTLGRNDIPMGEFWACSETHRTRDEDRLFGKQPASAAHIYGKKYVNAEAFTTIGPQWEKDPWDLKPVADREFCEGVNRIFFHQFSSSSPDFGKPGYESFAGTHFNPNITWWQQAHAWTNYISRCQFLLQKGLFVADVCYYYGDDVPNFVPLKNVDPSLGPGYDYDVTNTEVILARMSVKDELIVLPDGMSYRILVLPDWQTMRIDVLKRITELVKGGATVVGPKPQSTPGLLNYPECDTTIKELSDVLWGQCDGKKVKENSYGQGRIFWGVPLREILMSDGIPPDFEYKSRQEGTMWDFIHRTSEDAEIYFIINRNNCYGEAVCQFRVDDKAPEIWDPATGKMQEQMIYNIENGRTTIPIRLDPYGSMFVVFRKNPNRDHVVSLLRNGRDVFATIGEQVSATPVAELVPVNNGNIELQTWEQGRYEIKTLQDKVFQIDVDWIPEPYEITGPWEIRFPKGWGVPESIVFKKLKSWTESSDPGVKYYSGTAIYLKEFTVSEEMVTNTYLALDLGKVKNIAEVRLNGKELGILWKKPFQVDVTNAVKIGENQLEIEVTNLWPNRLIGDQFLSKEKRYTRTNVIKFTKDYPLLESGLLGPVYLLAAESKEVDL